MRRHTLLFLMLAASRALFSQLVINEIAPRGGILDADGNNADWIEIYNAGGTAVNLMDYGLSDDALNPHKWQFPSFTLGPGGYVIVLASGSSVANATNHWETAVYASDIWKYKPGTIEPAPNWTHVDFDDTGWNTGMGGMGYGDGDDGTTIATTVSVYMRQPFYMADSSVITSAKLHADYDDAFVAYLNGVEIARSGNIVGTPPAHDALAGSEHEAGMYAGYPAEEWNIADDVLESLLIDGTNYLCVQVHNVSAASSDLSSNFWLSFGISTTDTYFGAVPAWFAAPLNYMQTNFKLSSTGETIYLSDADGNILDAKYAGDIAFGQSEARIPDGSSNWCFTANISPESSNDGAICFTGYEPDPVFSLLSGFYSGTQTISITSPSPTSEIHYTLDGSAVTISSPVYTTPLTISANTVVSARCFSTGAMLPGHMSKQTYFIDEDDYTLPIVSISIDPGSLFDYDTGIYELGCCYDASYPYFGANFWQPWSRFAHVEYFNTSGISQWSKDADLEIHGGWSRAEAQKGFRVDFKSEYDGALEYPLWAGKPDMGPINNLNLRTGGQHVWTYKLQDAYLAKIMKETHIDYEEWQPCMLFIDGAPWGIYELREKSDEHFVESNYGINSNEVDFLNAWGALAGSDTGFVNLYNNTMAADPTSDAFYNMFNQYVDVENYMDYYIGEIYYQNVDFGGYYWGVNNTKVWRHQGGGKFRFVMYDLDGAMGYFGSVPSDNYITLTRNPYYPNAFSQIFDQVLNNIPLRNYFVNRFADLINTIYMQPNMQNTLYAMRDSIIGEIPHQLEVWGMPDEGTVNYYVDNLLSYNYSRHATSRSQINSSFGLSGQKTVTLTVTPPEAGYIKINTIIPGESPWSGVYFNGVPITLTAIPNPGYTFIDWDPNTIIPAGSTDASITVNMTLSATFNAVFNGAPVIPDITVSELNYHSNNSMDAGDWVELNNHGAIDLDLGGWRLKDRSDANFYEMPAGTVMHPGDYLVIAQDPIKFAAQFPGVTNMIGGFFFNFDDNGDDIRLVRPDSTVELMFTYADSLLWPVGADGDGRTLERLDYGTDMNNAANWFDGCMQGSPGTAYTPCENDLVFGEINYHSAAGSDAGDWIEIWNTSGTALDISGWKFVDGADTLVYLFPSGTILDADARLVVAGDITKFTSRHPDISNYTGPFLFTLSDGGEAVRLVDEHGIVRFTVEYSDTAPWPATADGGGKTLELSDPSGKMNEADNWFAGCPEGSPGDVYDPSCIVLSVNEVSDDAVSIFPNPSLTDFTIALNETNDDPVTISFIDNAGQVLQTETVNGSATVIIHREHLPSGIYWVRIIAGDRVVMEKVILL